MGQIRLFVSDDNHKIFKIQEGRKEPVVEGYTIHDYICPLTGKAFKNRRDFWDYIKATKIQPNEFSYDRQLNVENEENISKLFDITHLEYLWFNYLKDENKLFETIKSKDKKNLLKNFKNRKNRQLLENLLGLIDLKLYNILHKLYNGNMDFTKVINENIKEEVKVGQAKVESENNVESVKVESDKVESGNLESGNLESDKVESGNLESGNLESDNLESEGLPVNELIDNVLDLIKTKGLKYIATELNIANGTVQRWVDNKKVPKSYQFEIKKLSSCDIDYTEFTYKEKDQFFTPSNISEYTINTFKKIMKENNVDINDYTFIEPSAGDGSFTKLLPENSISLDIEPRNKKIIKQDYLKWSPPNKGSYITMGNPPFGLRGNLALRFINHSSKFSDHLCFLLPPLFESDGRGSPMKRVIGYNLIHSEKIDTNFYDPEGNEIKVNVILQIWSKYIKNDKYKIKTNDNKLFKVYSLSDGGTSGSTRNKDMLNKCDIYIPSTCFGIENMKIYNSFKELPKQRGYGVVFHDKKNENIDKSKNIDWGKISFLSTNSAYNLRVSKITDALLDIM